MYLKTLTLRGFKSFASSTTLQLEPGITCVVGPNGSGKSNVVDALAWVMGEQGAKSLRGGKMEDVIFAGTAGRPPLGRAEVLLTIDNTDGALPIDYAEVTISRTMFRNGGSDYAINGQACRLLDVQELLSDSGIGREMHVIVGQGQLDAVLSATPEERRGFVEEAAGVLKHRKRKEKALRKLEAMQANLARLQDLTAELRRQLTPLGRQAEVARRASSIQANLRDARVRLLADELVQARAALEQEVADESALRERQARLGAELEGGRAREAALEERLAGLAPRLARAQETWYRLSSMRERTRGTASLAAERARHLVSADEAPRQGRDPEELDAEAARVRGQEAELAAGTAAARTGLEAAVSHRQEVEAALAAEERRLAALVRAAADRRAGLARLSGQVDGLRRRAAAAEAELERLGTAREDALARAATAEHDFTALETTIAGLSVGEEGLDEEHERAANRLEEIEAELSALRQEEQQAERERGALAARTEALELGLSRKDGGQALLAASDRVSGVLGSVAALLAVEPGWEAAVAGALGEAADAVAMGSLEEAVSALEHLRAEDLGRVGLLVGGDAGVDPGVTAAGDQAGDAPGGRPGREPLPGGLRYVADLVSAPPELGPALSVLLAGVVAVEDLPAARALVAELPGLAAVTRDGDLVGRVYTRGGSSTAPSPLEVQAALDEAADRLAEVTHRCDRLRFRLAEVGARRELAAAEVAGALSRLHESDAELAAVAEQLGRLGSAARAAAEEAARLAGAARDAEAARDRDLAGLADLEARLAAAGDDPDDIEEPATDERDRLAEAARAARQAETEARLTVRTGEERARALAGRADALERTARHEREARRRAEEAARGRAAEARVAAEVVVAAERVLARLEASLGVAEVERAEADRERTDREQELTQLRSTVRRLAGELDEVTSSVHRDEVARAEQRMRVEALETRAVDELGVDATTLVEEYGPHLPVPLTASEPTADGEEVAPRPYVREEQVRRARAAERALAQLGKVNPLALEEFAALEERHAFLVEQLEDVTRTRHDLLGIVKEVDDRVQQVFAAAWEDTAREFEKVFARLFPGGEGRLVLTEPHDLLTTGIDVEARPPGKKVKRLSLLSGGERSLVAVAFLVALFTARPSPFYVLDEVEAALDDTNLGRLLEIYQELRENSQLIVITHQKRTMEVADALYGVSMRGDGVTAVISQRIRESEAV
ncbi:MAG TPA: chromosome segregation protein SMC [Jiangellales bacterium]|nr:chromosome segregation protein SMC [Jiangellales bacterium]